MNAVEIAAELRRELQALPERKTVPMRQVRQNYSRRLKDQSAEAVHYVAEALLAAGGPRWIAYELIAEHENAYRALNRRRLEALGAGMSSWQQVDSFARSLSGPAWRDGLITAGTIRAWAGSPDRWWRRAALVSTVALNVRSHGGQGDVDATLDICSRLLDDRDDIVVKAMSWALRELVPHDPARLRAYIVKHEDRLAARVKREVANKLQTGLKNP